MAISPTGPVSLLDVQTEFGGSNPIAIDEYYQDAVTGYVTSSNYTPASQIPGSGAISLQNFRGTAKITTFIFNDTVTANTSDYSVYHRAGLAGWNGVSTLFATITINAGVYVYATPGNSAFATRGGIGPFPEILPVGSTVTLINNGTIAGYGGAAGAGGNATGTTLTAGSAGGAGGPALVAQYPMDVYNNGTIGGGGGGGGGGGAAWTISSDAQPLTQSWNTAGGGGGGGRVNGAGGLGGTGSAVDWPDSGYNGTAGTLFAPGVGVGSGAISGAGQQTTISGAVISGGVGGNGGAFGQAGFGGSAGSVVGFTDASQTSLGGAGGAAGNAVQGGGNITWYAFGTRLGAIDNPGINMVPGGPYPTSAFEHSRIRFGVAIATMIFSSNGDTLVDGTGTIVSTSAPNWYTPITGGIGNSYWIRFSNVTSAGAGGFLTGPINTWVPLSSDVTISNSSGSGAGMLYTMTVEISTSATGTPVVHTNTLDLETINNQL